MVAGHLSEDQTVSSLPEDATRTAELTMLQAKRARKGKATAAQTLKKMGCVIQHSAALGERVRLLEDALEEGTRVGNDECSPFPVARHPH